MSETLRIALSVHGGWLFVSSSITAIVYAVDKRAAAAGKDRRGSSKRRRVPERTLHVLALLGGFAGAWLARRGLRHKTRKPGFAGVIAVAALIHAALLGAWLTWL